MELSIEKVYAYFKVQIEGKFNMHSDEAIEATGLSKEDYQEMIDHYNHYRNFYDDLYSAIEESYFSKITNRPRKLLNSERTALNYYSGYLHGLARMEIDDRKYLNRDDYEVLRKLYIRLKTLLDYE